MNKGIIKYLTIALMASPLMKAYGPSDSYYGFEETPSDAYKTYARELEAALGSYETGNVAEHAEAIAESERSGLFAPPSVNDEASVYEYTPNPVLEKVDELRRVAQKESAELVQGVAQESQVDVLLHEAQNVKDKAGLITRINNEIHHQEMNSFRDIPEIASVETGELTNTVPLPNYELELSVLQNPLPAESNYANVVASEWSYAQPSIVDGTDSIIQHEAFQRGCEAAGSLSNVTDVASLAMDKSLLEGADRFVSSKPYVVNMDSFQQNWEAAQSVLESQNQAAVTMINDIRGLPDYSAQLALPEQLSRREQLSQAARDASWSAQFKLQQLASKAQQVAGKVADKFDYSWRSLYFKAAESPKIGWMYTRAVDFVQANPKTAMALAVAAVAAKAYISKKAKVANTKAKVETQDKIKADLIKELQEKSTDFAKALDKLITGTFYMTFHFNGGKAQYVQQADTGLGELCKAHYNKMQDILSIEWNKDNKDEKIFFDFCIDVVALVVMNPIKAAAKASKSQTQFQAVVMKSQLQKQQLALRKLQAVKTPKTSWMGEGLGSCTTF